MRFIVDENVPLRTVAALTSEGHDVMDFRETSHEGMPDELLWPLATSEQRVLLSTDKGFLAYRDDAHFGCVIVRLSKPNAERIDVRMRQAIGHFDPGDWFGLTVVVRDHVMTVIRSKSTEV